MGTIQGHLACGQEAFKVPSLGQSGFGSRTKKTKRKNRMNTTTLKWMSLTLMAFALIACDGKKENRKLKEAAAVHEDMMTRYDSLYHVLSDKKIEINSRINQLTDDQRSANESMLRSIAKSFNILKGWEESVVGVPGYDFDFHQHHHGEADGHDHDHDHDHDHGRENDEILRGMSDQEVLDLQKALRNRFNEVSQEITTLLETIQMYEQRGN
jgi:hypothetical protein